MASRTVVLAVLFLVLLFFLPAIAFTASAGGHTQSMHHRLAEKSKPLRSIKANTQSYRTFRHRKLGEKTKPPGNVEFSVLSFGAVGGKTKPPGNGELWWKNSCRVHKNLKCTEAPTALLLSKCNHLKVESIRLLNSQQMHMSVEDCKDVILKDITIVAPGNSPNTDCIHIARTKDIQVLDCNIKTGDDCMSIETGTENLYASRIACGPGHGISVGSLGNKNSEARVSNITVYKANLIGTTNGARIKSWQGGKGYVKDITFEDIIMDKVKNPIIIDQNYCFMDDPLKPKACKKQTSAVELSDIQFKNI